MKFRISTRDRFWKYIRRLGDIKQTTCKKSKRKLVLLL